MKRSLRSHIESNINKTWSKKGRYNNGIVGLALLFPVDAFADAPTWTPGPDFRALNGASPCNTAFVRDNGDGTQTVVVAGLTAQLPSMTGGTWTEDEVWTVTAPVDDFDGCGLGSSAYGITAMWHVPGAVIERELYATHPAAAVDAYWEEFQKTYGFLPEGEHRGAGGWPFGKGQAWTYLICYPDGRAGEDEVTLLETAVALARKFDAKARVYPYNLHRKELEGPFGDDSVSCLRFVARSMGKAL
ncbi:hypothetical protein ACIBBE_24585 [Streptomyces sp. NPDC051644]|uniref:hypothetical protein n=1 Tax=Streptomyces sp. NPDC051644 TaxID=3365666 RepID=UPI0037938692